MTVSISPKAPHLLSILIGTTTMVIKDLRVADDFQGQYQAAELAYAICGYNKCERISLSLLEELENSEHESRYESGFAELEAILRLLLGHIALHRRKQPGQVMSDSSEILQEQINRDYRGRT